MNCVCERVAEWCRSAVRVVTERSSFAFQMGLADLHKLDR